MKTSWSCAGTWLIAGVVLGLAGCQNPPTDPPPVASRPPPPDIYGEELERLNLPLDIHPIQVVQDPPHEALLEKIPLIVDKPTMVRVFATLPAGSPGVANVRCSLWWNGAAHEITAHLVPVLGRTWVIPLADWATFAAMGPVSLAQANDDGRYWAYNFTFGSGLPAPAGPAPLVLMAVLDVNGQPFAARIETSQQEFKIKPFKGGRGGPNFVAAVRVFRTNGVIPQGFGGAAMADYAELLREALDIRAQHLAVLPIPPNRFWFNLPPPPMVPLPPAPPGPPTVNIFDDNGGYVDTFAGPLSHTQAVEGRFPTADGIYLVTNDGFKRGIGGIQGGNEAGWSPVGSDHVHYLAKNEPLTDLVSVHEKGHDAAYHGAGHGAWTKVEDGWDTGALIFRTSRTTRNRNNLMFDATTGPRDDPWTVPAEYRKVLDLLVTGGKDPVLISVRGLIRSDGRAEFLPPSLRMGVVPAPLAGEGTVVIRDPRGRELSRAEFPVRTPPEKDASWRAGFAVEAELPDGADSVEVELPGGLRQQWKVGRGAPLVAIESLDISADGRMAELTVQTDAGADSLKWSYTPEGVTRLDVIAEKIGENRYRIDLGAMPGAAEARLIATVTRDLRLAETASAPFALPDRLPWLHVALRNNEWDAIAYDPEDGFLEPEWFADGVIPLGKGSSFAAARLKLLGLDRAKLEAKVRDQAGHEVAGVAQR